MRARALTASTISSEGRFKVHCLVRFRFSVVFELYSKPNMQRPPSHQAEDTGPMFEDPSSFVVAMRTTHVPQYRIDGWICDFDIVRELERMSQSEQCCLVIIFKL